MVADPATGILTATPIVVHPAGGVLTATDLQTLQTANVTTFRYDFSGSSAGASWSPGTVTIKLAQTSSTAWADSNGDEGQPQTFTFEVLGPTADLVSPTNGSGIDVNTLNGRGYVDVTLPTPPTGYAIDWAAVVSSTPIFSFAGPGAGTAAVDPTQAPVLIDASTGAVLTPATAPADPSQVKVRYWTTGTFAASGDVTAVFVPGGPPLTETLGTATNGVLQSFVHDDGPQAIDVTFPDVPAGDVLDPTTIGFTQFIARAGPAAAPSRSTRPSRRRCWPTGGPSATA